ncbi:MAG TPA: riboflavin synthase [Alphaproteobacteria bacterium]|nr:riboflavin synthase [Alphaproteobacteria bacterium]HOO51651.1 riboflavin synthase [Alphaproteobacteria bacterium]
MFTGIITAKGTIAQVDETRGDKRFVIETPWDMTEVPMGASIACSGCCLTVVDKTKNSFTVDVSAESLSKTNLNDWVVGTKINLESSLRFGDELGGHLVSGHVDGIATLESIEREGDSHRLKIRVPQNLKHFIASKGSVALDGISLTINEVEDDVFGVNIIPHTWEVTTLGGRQVGDKINLEIDMLARYVARILGKEAA